MTAKNVDHFAFGKHSPGRKFYLPKRSPDWGGEACCNSYAEVFTVGRNIDGLRCMKSFDCCMYTSRQLTAPEKEECVAVGRLTNTDHQTKKEAKVQG
jgi:hypothetical protein